MSAREIIAQIEALPEKEKATVFDYVHKVEAEAEAPADKQGVNPVIANESADRIFQNYDNLFRKLAK